MKKIKQLALFTMLALCSISAINAEGVNDEQKFYIDEEELGDFTKGDAFHVHIGNNVWIETNTVHRDATGLYSYEHNIRKSLNGSQMEYQKVWKCPYCHNYWPIGQACQKPDCPSKYKDNRKK